MSSTRKGSFVALAVVLATLGAPVIAMAQAPQLVSDIRIDAEGDDTVIHLVGAAVAAPQLLSSRGEVRVWLPEARDDVWLDRLGDGRAIKWVRARPGRAGTTVVQIRLGDNRALPRSAVRIDAANGETRIRIARVALPSVATAVAVAAPAGTPAQSETSTPTGSRAARSSTSPSPSPSTSPSTSTPTPTPTPTLTPTQTRPSTRARPQTHARTPVRARRSHGHARPRFATASAGPGLGVLVLVTLLLGAVYCGIRFMMGRRGTFLQKRRAEIDIVATKRLGARHQLVVVRVRGRDYLLSINGATTQRIATLPSFDADADADSAPTDDRASTESGPRLRLPLLSRVRKAAQPPPAASSRPAPTAEPQFGAELFELANAKARIARAQSGAAPAANARSVESISGLLRLRDLAQG